MFRVKPASNIFFHPINYSKLFTHGRMHCLVFVCWFSFIMLGTFLIGLTSNLYSKEFPFCSSLQTFCSHQFTISQQKELFIYVILENFYQNNRMFLDSYSPIQLQSNLGNNYYCEGYDTYEKLNVSFNVGGYHMPKSASAHPCGKVMRSLFNDSIYLVSSQGSALPLTSMDLVSQYNKQHKFINLNNYLWRQWTDVQSPQFANYFTLSFTYTKYLLMGKVQLIPDSYQLMMKNNFLLKENGVVRKKILVSEVNWLGVKDLVIGFGMFIWGICGIFFHTVICFIRRK